MAMFKGNSREDVSGSEFDDVPSGSKLSIGGLWNIEYWLEPAELPSLPSPRVALLAKLARLESLRALTEALFIGLQ